MNASAPTQPALFDLRGRVVLLTGATGGLGLAMAQALAAHGATLLLSDRDAQATAQNAKRLAEGGCNAQALPCDLSQPDAVRSLAAQAQALHGGIDTLVCNAGMQGPAGPLSATTDADWQAVLDVNLRSAVTLTSGLLPGMAARGGGSVVLMASIAALRGNQAIGLYGISKAALAQLARNLAVEWGPKNVRLVAIAPGS